MLAIIKINDPMRIILAIPVFFMFQLTLMSQIYISTQEQVDEFYDDYPTTTLSTSIIISGNAVKNLDSLYRLDSIQGFLMIVDTELEDLNGLVNLTFLESLILEGNVNLKNYEGLINLDSFLSSLSINGTQIDTFPYLPNLQLIGYLSISNNSELVDISNLDLLEFLKITINNNTNLSVCANSAICNHLLSFKEYSIKNNSIGCKNREEIILNCPNYEPCYFDQTSVLFDFDSWTNFNLPSGWIGNLDTIVFNDNTLVSITQSQSITSIDGHSINLTTLTTPWVGIIEGAIAMDVYTLENYIDISFEYCFEETPSTQFSGKGSILINNVDIWNTGINNSIEYVDCNNPRQVEICNIPIPQGLDSISVALKNKALFSAVDGAISSSWIVDNFMLNNVGSISGNTQVIYSPDVVLSPNPTLNTISVNANIEFSSYAVYDIFSNEVTSGYFNNPIDLSDLNYGLYILVLQSENYSYSEIISKL